MLSMDRLEVTQVHAHICCQWRDATVLYALQMFLAVYVVLVVKFPRAKTVRTFDWRDSLFRLIVQGRGRVALVMLSYGRTGMLIYCSG